MKKTLIIVVLLFSSSVFAKPNEFINKLMSTPIDKFTYGMHMCDKLLDAREDDINFKLKWEAGAGLPDHYYLMKSSCYYDFNDNQIYLNFILGDGKYDVATNFNNEKCLQIILSMKNLFVHNYVSGEKTQYVNDITYLFTSNMFSTDFDDEIKATLEDYIFIRIIANKGNGCESNIKNGEKVLYYK